MLGSPQKMLKKNIFFIVCYIIKNTKKKIYNKKQLEMLHFQII